MDRQAPTDKRDRTLNMQMARQMDRQTVRLARVWLVLFRTNNVESCLTELKIAAAATAAAVRRRGEATCKSYPSPLGLNEQGGCQERDGTQFTLASHARRQTHTLRHHDVDGLKFDCVHAWVWWMVKGGVVNAELFACLCLCNNLFITRPKLPRVFAENTNIAKGNRLYISTTTRAIICHIGTKRKINTCEFVVQVRKSLWMLL